MKKNTMILKIFIYRSEKLSNKSGGAAQNGGATYQNKVTGYFLIQMALSLNCVSALGGGNLSKKILKVAIETDDDVDDIVLTHEGYLSYLQVKRKLSLSVNESSPFYKTINQFVKQFYKSQNDKDSYIAISTRETSSIISKDLKKIVNSARLNPDSYEQNPENKAESNAYEVLQECIEKSWEKNSFGELPSSTMKQLISRIYFVELDIEEDGQSVRSLLELMESKFTIEPNLIWSLVVEKSGVYAKNRQSITIAGIDALLGKYKMVPITQTHDRLKSICEVKFDLDNFAIASGFEWVLIDSSETKVDYELAQLIRFDDNGKLNHTFKQDSVVMKSGKEYKLHARFSTLERAKIYLDEFPQFTQSFGINPLKLQNSANYDHHIIAKAHSDKVRKQTSVNDATTTCMHCEKGLLFPSYFVEIQEEGLPFDTGFIHRNCLRPSDRILGTVDSSYFKQKPELNGLDFNKWINALNGGQGYWGWIQEQSLSSNVRKIFWDHSPPSDPNGAYCIKIELVNGESLYVLKRGKVERFNELEAKNVCSDLNERIKVGNAVNNSLYSTSLGSSMGTKRFFQDEVLDPSLKVAECKLFSVTRFTRGISEQFDLLENFYAPLIAFVDLKTDKYVEFKDDIFLISNPNELGGYLKNWSDNGLKPEFYRLEIILNDSEFDKLMHSACQKNLTVVVDPLFNSDGNLAKGGMFSIVKME